MIMALLQELMPQLLTILQRGRDSTAVYGILEGYLLLGGVAVLQGHESMLAGALQGSFSQVLQKLAVPPQPPAQPTGSPQSRPGKISSSIFCTARCEELGRGQLCTHMLPVCSIQHIHHVKKNMVCFLGMQGQIQARCLQSSYRRRLQQPASQMCC